MKAKTIQVTEGEFRLISGDSGGWCLACGGEAYGVEPDARGYECEGCEKRAVYGAEEALMMGYVVFVGDDGGRS